MLGIHSEVIIKNTVKGAVGQFYQPLIRLQIHKEEPPITQIGSSLPWSYAINISLRLFPNKTAQRTGISLLRGKKVNW